MEGVERYFLHIGATRLGLVAHCVAVGRQRWLALTLGSEEWSTNWGRPLKIVCITYPSQHPGLCVCLHRHALPASHNKSFMHITTCTRACAHTHAQMKRGSISCEERPQGWMLFSSWINLSCRGFSVAFTYVYMWVWICVCVCLCPCILCMLECVVSALWQIILMLPHNIFTVHKLNPVTPDHRICPIPCLPLDTAGGLTFDLWQTACVWRWKGHLSCCPQPPAVSFTSTHSGVADWLPHCPPPPTPPPTHCPSVCAAVGS